MFSIFPDKALNFLKAGIMSVLVTNIYNVYPVPGTQ